METKIKRKSMISVPPRSQLITQIAEIVAQIPPEHERTPELVKQMFQTRYKYTPGEFTSLYQKALDYLFPTEEGKDLTEEVKRKVFVKEGKVAHTYNVSDIAARPLRDVLMDHFPTIHIHNVISGVGEPRSLSAHTVWGETPMVLIIQS